MTPQQHLVRTAMTRDEQLDDIKRARIWTALEDRITEDAARRPARPDSRPRSRLGPRPRPSLGTVFATAAAALACAAVAILLLWPASPDHEVFTVPAHATASSQLGPHTRAALVGPARLALRATGDATVVALERGTLLADFAGGPARSLRIDAPGATIEIVGTLFAVEVSARTCTSVAHGRVKVTSKATATVTYVGAGERYCIDAAVEPMPPRVREALERHAATITAEAPTTTPARGSAATPPTSPAPSPSSPTSSPPTSPAPTPSSPSPSPPISPAPTPSSPTSPAPTPSSPSPGDVGDARVVTSPASSTAHRAPSAAHPSAAAKASSTTTTTPWSRSAKPANTATTSTATSNTHAKSSTNTATTSTTDTNTTAKSAAPNTAAPNTAAPNTAAPSTAAPNTAAPNRAAPAVADARATSPTGSTSPIPSPPTPRPVAKSAPSATDLYRAADDALAARDLAAADRALAMLVATAPTSPLVEQAHFDRARIAQQRKQWRAAREHLARLAAGGMLAEPAHWLRCRIEIDAGDASAARACLVEYRRTFARSPHDLDAIALLARQAHASGGCVAARVHVDELAARYPRTTLAASWRARCPASGGRP